MYKPSNLLAVSMIKNHNFLKNITKTSYIAIFLVTLLGLLRLGDNSSIVAIAATPTSTPMSLSIQTLSDEPLIQPADLQYSGAFRVPFGNFGPGPNDLFDYSNEGLAFNPANNSLFMKCKGASLNDSSQQHVAEVNIPSLVIGGSLGSLNTATIGQNCADITENHLNPQGIANGMSIGGLLVSNGKLIGSEWAYYDGAAQQTTSHFSHSLTLNQSGTYQGQYTLNAPFPAYVGGYMTTIPPEWQSLLGGTALTGHCCTSIIGHQSTGPSVFAFDPSNMGVMSPVPTIPMLSEVLDMYFV